MMWSGLFTVMNISGRAHTSHAFVPPIRLSTGHLRFRLNVYVCVYQDVLMCVCSLLFAFRILKLAQFKGVLNNDLCFLNRNLTTQVRQVESGFQQLVCCTH